MNFLVSIFSLPFLFYRQLSLHVLFSSFSIFSESRFVPFWLSITVYGDFA